MININFNLFKGNDDEQWRPIPGYPGYEVSDQGRVKSLKFGRERILKQRKRNDGYLDIHLWKHGREQRKFIHRLVLEAFVGNPGGKLECNHRNGIKTDNRLENLEWIDHSGNIRHAFKTGLKSHKGEKNPRAKLTAEEVLKIHEILVEGVPVREIAEIFGVSLTTIYDIKSGRRWSHVTGITRSKPHSKNAAQSIPITINLNFWLAREAF